MRAISIYESQNYTQNQQPAPWKSHKIARLHTSIVNYSSWINISHENCTEHFVFSFSEIHLHLIWCMQSKSLKCIEYFQWNLPPIFLYQRHTKTIKQNAARKSIRLHIITLYLNLNRIESNRIFWFICCGIKKTYPHAVSVTAFVVFIESFIFSLMCAWKLRTLWWDLMMAQWQWTYSEFLWPSRAFRHSALTIEWKKKIVHLFGSTKYYRKYSW